MNIILLKRKKGEKGEPDLVMSLNKKKVAAAIMSLLVVFPVLFLFTGYKIGLHYKDNYVGDGYFGVKVSDSKGMSKYEKPNKPYEAQLESLNNVQKSLDDLKMFINRHENKLKIEQEALEHMLNQKQTLKPLLQADQDVVDAMFSIQHQKYEEQKWSDRFVSFVVGVVASIIGAFAFSWLKRRYKLVINANDKEADKNN